MKLRLFIGALVMLITLQNCTVKKRAYKKGYYVDWAKNKTSKKKSNAKESVVEAQIEKPEVIIVGLETRSLEASANRKTNTQQLTTRTTLKFNPDTCGDKMVFKNAEQLLVKVIEINEEQIKYKRCDNIGGPVYSVGKEKISHIIYANGIKETIEPPVRKPMIQAASNGEKGYPSELIWACVLPFILSALGIIISIFQLFKAKRKIRNNPQIYKGINLADFMLVFDFSIIGMAFVLYAALLYQTWALLLVGFIAWLVLITASAIYFFTRK